MNRGTTAPTLTHPKYVAPPSVRTTNQTVSSRNPIPVRTLDNTNGHIYWAFVATPQPLCSSLHPAPVSVCHSIIIILMEGGLPPLPPDALCPPPPLC